MNRRVILLTLAALFACVTVSLAANPHMGTWKLNEAKSKFKLGAPKNHRISIDIKDYSLEPGDSVKVIVNGVDGNGKVTHNEWTGKFDGKWYPVTGDATSDMRSYRQIDPHTLLLTVKKDNKVTLTGRITVSPDGRTRTVTTTGTDAQGKRVTNRAVYDKQ